MGTHWTDRRAAVVELGWALERRGWKLWGYKPDKSDMMTDYFDPASWRGLATKGDMVAVVDTWGEDIKRFGIETGILLSDPGPKAPVWRVERIVNRAGKVLASGSGLFSLLKGTGAMSYSEEKIAREARFDALAGRMETAAMREAALLDKPEPTSASPVDGVPHSVTVDGITVRISSVKPENAEVVFPAKPSDDLRNELKAAGYRWSRFASCWYGKAERLPARYATLLAVTPAEGVA